MRLASSFGSAARAYAEHRPDYAPAAVQWALEAAPGCRVLDLGAGTGKLAGTLLGVGAEVTAVEPDPATLKVKSGTSQLHVTVSADGYKPTGWVAAYEGDTYLTSAQLVDGKAVLEGEAWVALPRAAQG